MKGQDAQHLTTLTRIVILTAFYFVGGLVGMEGAFLSGSVALVWPPAGIALAAILLFGYRFWPGIALGAVLFSCMNGIPLGFFTLGTAIGNTVGALVCAYLLRQLSDFQPDLGRVRDVVAFIGLACLLGTTVNATFNVVSLIYAGQAGWEGLFESVLTWWVPNSLAALVVTPVILAWAKPDRIRWESRRLIEAGICAVGLAAGTLISFHSWFVYGIQNYPLAYLPFPFLVWASLRFGQRGATTSTLLVCTLAIHSLLQGRGPFVSHTEVESLMLIGSYIGILAVTNMLLAAAANERRMAEAALAESERRLRAVVEDQTDLICRFRRDGTLTFVNSAYCRHRGMSREALLGTNFLHELSEQDSAAPLEQFATLPREQPVISFDHRTVDAAGRITWQQITVRRLFGEDGTPDEFQAVIQDITHRKETEASLRASERKYRSLVDHMPDIVWTTNARRELVYVSENAARMLGCSREEMLRTGGPFWLERIHPNDAPHVEEAHQRLFTHGRKLDIEYRFRRPDGQWIWLHSRAPGTRVQDGVQIADGLTSDVTRRKQAEEALHHAKEAAEAANRAKSAFLANMSHELRTPLNAVIGFSEILADGTFGPLNERQLRYANNILASGRHLLQLINDILDLSKIEAGRLELSRTSFDAGAATRDVHNIVRALAAKKRIRLDLEAADGLPPLVADEPKFKQILYNLLSNAIKFTPDGGRVTTTLRRCTAEELRRLPKAASDGLRLAVQDTGIGIRPEDHTRIFLEFEQVDSSYGRKQQGTGLGLALTKRLVEMHGGTIWVESEGVEGKGSLFTVLLPLPAPATPAAEPVAVPAELLCPRLGLVLPGDGRRKVAEHLTACGYAVIEADTIAELASHVALGSLYGLVIDEALAGLQPGIQSDAFPARLPVLVVSAGAQGGTSFRAICSSDRAPAAAAARRLAAALNAAGQPPRAVARTVLVVEDEPASRELLARTLLLRGLRVLCAADGQRGLQLALRHRPDAIILDLEVPGLRGPDLVERLRAHPETRGIPVLIHTGTVVDEAARQHLASQVQAITSKTEPQRLLDNLDDVLAESNSQTEVTA